VSIKSCAIAHGWQKNAIMASRSKMKVVCRIHKIGCLATEMCAIARGRPRTALRCSGDKNTCGGTRT
jgi:fructose-1,6-bisphosphatase/inositol monophosphatase family enzyme